MGTRRERPDFARNASAGSNALAGTLIGFVSGVAAGWIMNRFQHGWSAAKQMVEQRADSSPGEPATVKAADRISKAATGGPVPAPDRELAGEVVHYVFGGFLGSVYGALGTQLPQVRTGFGTLFGTVVALVGDEMFVPALKLAPPPDESPIATHFYGLVSHLVFGVALEGSRRGLEAALAVARTDRR